MTTIKDSSALFLYGSYSDDATLSGGSWSSDLPLSNLQKDRLEKIARSSDTDTDSTQFKISLKEPVEIAAIYLGWTNLSVDASIRIRFWLTSSFSGTPHYDTDWLTDIIPDDPDPDRGPSIYHILENATAAQFISVEIDDEDNPNDHIDIARLVIGRYLKPSFNYTYDGNSFNFVSKALVASTLSGDEVVWDRAEPRTFSLGFQYLPESEVFTDFYRMIRTVKRGGEIVVIPDPNAGSLELQRRSFLGRTVNRDGIIQAVVNRGNASLQIQEKMGLSPLMTAKIYKGTFSGGSFTLAGGDVDFALATIVAMESGSFVLTGQALGTIRALITHLDAGSFALAGQDAGLINSIMTPMGRGSFTLTAEDAELTTERVADLSSGSFTLAGQAVDLIIRRLAVDAGVFSLTGKDMGFQRALIIDLSEGSFTITGQGVELGVGKFALLDKGSFTLTGNDADLLRALTKTLDDGSFSVSGQDAALIIARTDALDEGSFTLTGEDIGITRSLKMELGAASFGLTGQSALIRDYDYRIVTGDESGRRALAGDEAGNLRRTT